METIYGLKEKMDDFEVEYDILSPFEIRDGYREIESSIQEIDSIISEKEQRLTEINADIERFTNHSDGVDYAMAVTCGLITGIIDSVFVGEWDFKTAKDKVNQDMNEKVIRFAKKHKKDYQDYLDHKRHSNSDLENAVAFLEGKYKLPGDGDYKPYKKLKGITDKTHHLDDFCHHPTLIGLICSIIVQFSGETKYHPANETMEPLPIQVNSYGVFVSHEKWGKVFAGIINWFFTAAKTIANQKGHLMSDLVGSSKSVGRGTDGAGLPGSFLSTLKELSALPIIKDTELAENLRKAFQNGIGKGKKQLDLGPFNSLFQGADSRVDLRTEKAVLGELKRQAVPVLLNEMLIRGCYFIRRIISQMKDKESIKEINFIEAMPYNNRTIARMVTIASGTFMVTDVADAAVRSAVKSKGFGPEFASNMILRVNFVGIGRFALAIGVDVGMEARKEIKRNERCKLMAEVISLNGAKLYYKQANMWSVAEATELEIDEMIDTAQKAIMVFTRSISDISSDMEFVSKKMSVISNNKTLSDKYRKILRR